MYTGWRVPIHAAFRAYSQEKMYVQSNNEKRVGINDEMTDFVPQPKLPG